MKQELSNQFTEGLVCDLNPIITPNTVLTDNLNGTIITYDGNEYSLQNDKGNYALQHCKLRPNYIPVGVKEYSDILYIVSYNPLDDHVEIGSYPSPLTIEASNIDDEHHEIDSLIQQIGESEEVPLVNGEPNTANFSDLIKQSKMKLFYGDSEEEYKMYPGDSYIVEVEGEHEYKYEELEYYIVDENRQKYNVSDLVEDENVEQIGKIKYESDDYINVAWQVPGWLGMQYRLATFEDFSMNIRHFVIPNIGTTNLSATDVKLNFQFKISDKLFLKDQDVTKGDLSIKLNAEINTESGSQRTIEKIISLEKATFIEWYEESKILWIDYDDEEFKNFFSAMNSTDIIKLTAIPFFTVKEKSLFYDPFKEIIEIPLNSIGDWSDFKLGSSIWKFWAELEKGELIPSNCYLEFDVTGPLVTTSKVNLYYKLYDITGSELTDYVELENYGGVSDLNYLSIAFNDVFQAEGIYAIELCFSGSIQNCNTEHSCSIKKLIITSQLFQFFVGTTDDFSTIGFDEWTGMYSKYLKNNTTYKLECKDFLASSNMVSKGDFNNIASIESDPLLKEIWNKNNTNFTSFISSSKMSELKDKTVTFIRGVECNGNVLINNDSSVLEGPLWKNLATTVTHVGKINDIDAFKNNANINDDVSVPVTTVCGNTLVYSYETQMNGVGPKDFNSIKKCKDIEFFILDCRKGHEGANDFIQYTLRYNSNFNWGLTFTEQFSEFKDVATFTAWDKSNSVIKTDNVICNKMLEIMNNSESDFALVIPIITQLEGACSRYIPPSGWENWTSTMSYEIAVCHGDDKSESVVSQSVQHYGTTAIIHPYLAVRYNDLVKLNYYQIEDFTDRYGSKNENCVWLYKDSEKIDEFIVAIGENVNHSLATLKNINAKINSITKVLTDDALTSGAWVYPLEQTKDANKNSLHVVSTVNNINKWTYDDYNIDLLQNYSRTIVCNNLAEIGVNVGNLLNGSKSELQGFIIGDNKISDFYIDGLQERLDDIDSYIEEIRQQVSVIQEKCYTEVSIWNNNDMFDNQSEIKRGFYGKDLQGGFYDSLQSNFKLNSSKFITSSAIGSWLNISIRKNSGKKPNNQNAEAWFGYIISNVLYQI